MQKLQVKQRLKIKDIVHTWWSDKIIQFFLCLKQCFNRKACITAGCLNMTDKAHGKFS